MCRSVPGLTVSCAVFSWCPWGVLLFSVGRTGLEVDLKERGDEEELAEEGGEAAVVVKRIYKKM